jgi:hypothetical protein
MSYIRQIFKAIQINNLRAACRNAKWHCPAQNPATQAGELPFTKRNPDRRSEISGVQALLRMIAALSSLPRSAS